MTQLDKYHKSQHFDFSNGVAMLLGDEKPGIGGEPLTGQKLRPKYSIYPKGKDNDLPSWMAFDKQVKELSSSSHVVHIFL